MGVTWDEAVAYAAWRGNGWRLPCEWELAYAESLIPPDADFSAWPLPELPDVGGPHSVRVPDTEVADLTGVVHAWCGDTSAGLARVSRGGSWAYRPAEARVAYRIGDAPGVRGHSLGFRLARSAP